MGKSHAIVPRGWVKVSEFEALTGLNNRTVTLAIKRGRIPPEFWRRVGEGKTSPICINPQPAAVHWYRRINGTHHLTQPLREKLVEYIRTFDPAAVEDQEGIREENTIIEKTDGESGMNKGTGGEDSGGTGEKMTFAEAQRRKEVAKAKTAELELLEKQGTLILKQRVQDQLFMAGKELRDALLAIPDRVTDEILAAGDNRTRVNNILYDAIAGELERLADLYLK